VYGLKFASKLYIEEMEPDSLAALDGGLKEGDTVVKVSTVVRERLSAL